MALILCNTIDVMFKIFLVHISISNLLEAITLYTCAEGARNMFRLRRTKCNCERNQNWTIPSIPRRSSSQAIITRGTYIRWELKNRCTFVVCTLKCSRYRFKTTVGVNFILKKCFFFWNRLQHVFELSFKYHDYYSTATWGCTVTRWN